MMDSGTRYLRRPVVWWLSRYERKELPMPWAALVENPKPGGDVVDFDKRIFEADPNDDRDGNFEWNAEYGRNSAIAIQERQDPECRRQPNSSRL